jgi:hypothetical protein
MPYFERIVDSIKKTKPIQLIFISLDFKEDYPKKILKTLKLKKIKTLSYWVSDANLNAFIDIVEKKWQGNIPITLIYKGNTKAMFFDEAIAEKKLIEVLSAF